MRGAVSIQELNGTIGHLKALAKFGHVDANIQTLLSEWEIMVNRRWNEWNLEKSPLTEAQFASWISSQLVFDSPQITPGIQLPEP